MELKTGVLAKMRRAFADVTIKDMDIVLASLLFFDPTGGNGKTVYSLLRYCLISYLVIKNLHCCKNAPIPVFFLSAFSIIMAYSTWINTHSLTWSFSGLMFGVGIIAVLFVFIDACRRLSSVVVLKRVLVIFAVILICNDLFMMALPYNREDSNTIYLIGNKFIVSYAHCLLSGLMLVCYKDKVVLSRAVIIFGAVMSYLAGSSTGAVIMAAMLVMTLIPEQARPFVASPLTLVASVAILNFLIWGPIDLFHTPEFQDFIVNVLHKSPNLTGRDRLYAATLDFVSKKPVLGWGYLTDIYRDTFGYGNAQNGLFHLITQCGMLGSVFYFSGLLASLGKKLFNNANVFGLYAFLLCMILGSAVEINLSFQFAFGVALICGTMRGVQSTGE